MTGSDSQVEWARRIRAQLQAEFDRVAAALAGTAPTGPKLAAVNALLAILEEKRDEIMSNDRAGYFIHQWQEPADRIRMLILSDPRYAEIRRALRR